MYSILNELYLDKIRSLGPGISWMFQESVFLIKNYKNIWDIFLIYYMAGSKDVLRFHTFASLHCTMCY